MFGIKRIIRRSRSQRAAGRVQVEEGGESVEDTCCWESIPEEILREVVQRVGEGWERKSVVACGGVCRRWRMITKEMVQVPELSGNLTFPISVKQPGPRDSLLQCFIKRCRSTQTYYLYLSLTNELTDDGKFLLAACKHPHATFTDFVISLASNNISKGSDAYVGQVRSNFLGTKFTVFDSHPPHATDRMIKSCSTSVVNFKQVSPKVPAGNYPVASVSYELDVLGARVPRRMQCTMDAIPATAIEPGGVAPTQTEFSQHTADFFPSLSFFWSKSNSLQNFLSGPLSNQKDSALVLKNKTPRWHEQLQCWCLNFHGRVTVASVKNFQLVATPKNGPAHEKIILQFGKVGKDLFTMDYRYPISAFQAFAICLSSFDTKVACE